MDVETPAFLEENHRFSRSMLDVGGSMNPMNLRPYPGDAWRQAASPGHGPAGRQQRPGGREKP